MDRHFDMNSEEGSDYTYSDSESDDFYNGYCERLTRGTRRNFISLPQLRSEYNVNMDMEKKQLLFLYAAEEEDIAFLQTLLGDSVPIDSVGVDGWTALMKAALNGKTNVLQFLLTNGSNANYQSDLFTPIMACCTYSCAPEEKKLECLELLITHHANINAFDKHKTSPLMIASSSGYLTLVNRLLAIHDLDINARDFDGWNAVFHAVSNNRINVVKRLIQFGLDYKTMDRIGRTVTGFAEERGYNKLSIVLLQYESNGVVVKEVENEENLFLKYVNELPNEDGEGGFEADTNTILRFYIAKKNRNIGVADFLNMDENDLYEAGVKLAALRRHLLLKVIHKFHLVPWSNLSMQAISRNLPMALEEGVSILGCMVKHLTLLKASLRYLRTRIDARKKELHKSLEIETASALVSCYEVNNKLREKLHAIIEMEGYVEPVEIADLIVKPAEEEPQTIRMFTNGWAIFGTATAGYVIFRFALKFGRLIKLLTFNRK